MTLKQIINGELVDMTSEEEEAFVAEQASAAVAIEEEKPLAPADPVDRLAAFLNANPDVKALLGM